MRTFTSVLCAAVLQAGLSVSFVLAAPQSPDAPKDKPQQIVAAEYQEFIKACEPYVKKARKSYPRAKSRFLAGLPPGHAFFVTVRLFDEKGRMEQVFVAVNRIADETIQGRLSSDLNVLSGYKLNDPIQVRESELVDWLITKPDGTEEGNIVGKFLDNYVPRSKKKS